MKRLHYFTVVLLLAAACTKEKINNTPIIAGPTVTSAEYIDKLLFVNKNNYQIATSAPATFSSTDPNITISSTGLVSRVTSGEIAAIDIVWKQQNIPKITIYALGATDIDQIQPAAYFHGETATEPYNNYVQGWKLLEKLPVTDATYVLVLRHADASFGRDWPSLHPEPEPPNWWKSTDSLLARQLNNQGVARATQLGQVFRDLNYPIKRVITSEYYRARQTAALINATPTFAIDYRINHTTHNVYLPGIFNGVLAIVGEQPIDNQMTLIITHHPSNEPSLNGGFPGFPVVSAFNWSGSYILKVNKDATLTYQGAVTYGMLTCWRDLKLKRIN